jgi:6-phosphogluconolactonase
MIYKFDPSHGTLVPANPAFIELKPGSGPRHFAINLSGSYLFVLNELASTIAVFEIDLSTGAVNEKQTISTLPEDFQGENTAAQILVSEDGRFLYASNRGDDSIVQFSIEADDGSLVPVEWIPSGGKTPRNFAIDPTGRWMFVANQHSDNIVIFKIDEESGRLNQTATLTGFNSPVCICFWKPI